MRERRLWVVVVPTALAIAVAVLASRQVSKAESWGRHQRFVGDAAVLAERIETGFSAHLNVIRGLSGFFRASEHVTREEFQKFSAAMEEASPRPTALAWAARVPVEERAAFESAQRTHHPGYQITEVGSDGAMRSAGERPVYYPVTYQLSPEPTPATGFDLASRPARREAIVRAHETGLPTATGPIDLLGGGDDRGFLIVQALKAPGHPNRGLLVGVFRTSELIKDAVGTTRPSGLRLALADVSGEDPSPLYEESGEQTDAWATTFEVAGRRWEVRVGLTEAYDDGPPFLSLAVLGGGLLLALLVGLLLWELTGRHDRVREEVRERTAALRTSESRYRTLFESAGVALWEEDLTELMARFDELRAEGVSDLAGWLAEHPDELRDLARRKRVTAVNPETLSLFGAESADELLGNLDPVFGKTAIGAIRSQLIALWRGARSFEREAVARTLDGSALQVYLRLRLSGTHDLPYRALVSLTDITQLKEAEHQLRQQMHQLERSNAELERFAYIASHDLQEPLRAISRFADLLAQDYRGRLDEDADEYIHFIVSGAERMQQLIEDLLTYSRLGRGEAAPRELPLDDLLDDVLADLSHQILETRAQVRRHPLPVIRGDEAELRQLLLNLVSNALKFRRTAPHTVEIGSVRTADGVQVRVRDNGTGIDADCVDRIFEVFYRGHSRSKYPGTGIGLAICKRVAEEHGGNIRVESQVGVGSTFYVELPEARIEADAA